MRRWWWTCSQWLVRIVGAPLWQLRAYGQRNIPRQGGLLLVSNHQSFLDPMLVASCLPREMHFMARRSLFRNPAFGALITAYNTFPVERGSADLKSVREAIARLQAGNLLLVFPEGTRSRDGTIGLMKGGAGILAARAGVPIVPVLVDGTNRAWPRGALPLPRMCRVSVVFGKPFRLEAGSGEETGDRIRNAVLRLKGELEGCRTASS